MKKLVLPAICLVLVLSLICRGEHPKNAFEVGPEVFSHKYEEPGLMEEKGTLYGVVMNATNHGPWMTAAQLEIAMGKLDYDGQTMGGDPLKIDNITDWLVDGRVLIGPEYVWSSGYGSPYIGLGYRWLWDEVSKQYAFGYDRASNYLYLPMGGTVTWVMGDGWSLSPTAEYDLLLYGEQISQLSDIDPLYSDISNSQTSGHGWRISLSVEKNFGSWGMKVQPFVRYWKIKQSDLDPQYEAFIEPENETTQTGVQAFFTF
jgi:hypothetical protein